MNQEELNKVSKHLDTLHGNELADGILDLVSKELKEISKNEFDNLTDEQKKLLDSGICPFCKVSMIKEDTFLYCPTNGCVNDEAWEL